MRWSTQRTGQQCWGESVWHQPHPSPQAYVNRFKFQSITADDTLGFFLEYFPELKEKGVDSIPGQHSTILAREQGLPLLSPAPTGVRADNVPQGLCTLLCVFYWRCCCCQPGSVGAGTGGTGQLGSGPGLGMCQLSLIFFSIQTQSLLYTWLLLHGVSVTQPGESGEHWDQAQLALWAWPSLAGDPGLAGTFHAGAGGAGADTHKHTLSPCV